MLYLDNINHGLLSPLPKYHEYTTEITNRYEQISEWVSDKSTTNNYQNWIFLSRYYYQTLCFFIKIFSVSNTHTCLTYWQLDNNYYLC